MSQNQENSKQSILSNTLRVQAKPLKGCGSGAGIYNNRFSMIK